MSKKSNSGLPTPPAPKTSYPSEFGSHPSMVDDAVTQLLNDPKLVVCKDDDGLYVTERNRLDGKLADPNRYASPLARDLKRFKITEEAIKKAHAPPVEPAAEPVAEPPVEPAHA